MSPAAFAAYEQLISVGLLWISLHCAGMCGPLLISLDVTGQGRGLNAKAGLGRILLYQFGRALTYAWLGAMAGLLGAGLKHVFAQAGGAVTLLLAALAISAGLTRLLPQLGWFSAKNKAAAGLTQLGAPKKGRVASWFDRMTAKAQTVVLPLAQDGRPMYTVALGAVMGFLPCMITLWAMGLAASTGSALHGALIMVGLVIMTSPVLATVTALPRLLGTRFRAISERAPAVLMLVSGVWFALVGLAGLKVISHAHLHFELSGKHYMIMFW